MRIDRLYIRSFLASAIFTCTCLALLFAFVYSTGFLGLAIICATVLILFACLYGWLRFFGFARRQTEAGSKSSGDAASPLAGEENVKRLKV
ncbi:MAG: hypothetical protein AABY51_03715 [Deltaproteobacteria bacterium]